VLESVELVESKPRLVELNMSQLDELTRLASDLAGSRAWWGQRNHDEAAETRVLNVEARGRGTYSVTVFNSVGTIGLPGLTLIVKPKIPIEHFIHVARRGLFSTSRRDRSPSYLAEGVEFSELVAMWLVAGVEELLRAGLEDDYTVVDERSSAVRGSIDVPATVVGWLRGDSRVACAFDEFSTDSPLNRVLRAALVSVSANHQMSHATRSAAAGLVRQMWEVGDLHPSDMNVQPRRGQLRYSETLGLAKQVLRAIGRSLETGGVRSSTFLFATPTLIEDGIRVILSSRLAPIVVRRHGRVLLPSSVSVNPDLEVGPPPFTGDVKYKVSDASWNRADLAQAVFFATAYRSPRALIVNFRNREVGPQDFLHVGDVRVGTATWDARPDAAPQESEDALVQDVRRVLDLAA